MQVPFGPLAPDAKATAPGVVMTAQNVLPLPEGYGPMRRLVAAASAAALSANPRGLISLVQRNGAYQVFAFTETTIQEMQADFTWVVTASGLSCTAGDDWSSVHFGDQLLATNTTDGLKAYNIELGGSVSAVADAGAPRSVFSCANVVVALDTLDNSGTRNNRLIRTSAFGDHTNWKTKGADYQPLDDGQELICGVSLKNNAAVVFQADAMRLMQFGNAGGGATFSLQSIADGRGAVGERSVISFDGVCYFLASNGFWKFSMNGLTPIGSGKVDQWFFDNVEISRLSEVQGSVDPSRKMVWWRFPSTAIGESVIFDDMIGYSWEFDRWVTAKVSTSYLSRIATPGYTLDSMDSFGPLDSIDIPLDSRFWAGGAPLFAAINADLKFATFSAGALAPLIQSRTANSPRSGLITSCTPLTDAANCTVALGVSDKLSDALTWKAASSIKPSGRVPLRGRGKNVSFRWANAQDEEWEYVKGVDHIDAGAGGVR
ncbi:hypothetical protein SAMN04487974_102124 [Pelagibacterium luteolum]|uniref:Uncharacterized protein n=1 Tax=Pelagibacterium luteolum TaxID=440168 RepID=A0A1G7THI3_9HYPH|nr:hypothetical protein SAMN04487974_102124 [Pelagibacterium luteolum]